MSGPKEIGYEVSKQQYEGGKINKSLVAICTIAIALTILNYFISRRRSNRIAAKAKELGIDFNRSFPLQKSIRQLNFTMLRLGSGFARSKNILTKNYDDMKISIFNHEIHNSRQVCSLITFINKKFPNFILYPNKFGIKTEIPLFKYKHIEIENEQNFSKKYLLYSDSPDSIISLFNRNLVFYIYGLDNLYLEGRENTLLFYQERVLLDEKRIAYYFDYTKNIALKFLQNK